MADISIQVTLDDDQQKVVLRLSKVLGSMFPDQPVPTPKQTLQRAVNEKLDELAAKYLNEDKTTLREAYEKASETEQDQIDAILAPYR